MAEKSPRLIAALAFAAAEIPVFPCVVNGKEPATPHGFADATTDVAQIEKWWSEADYNLAIEPERADEGGWAVIDLDGPEGLNAWTELVNKHGGSGQTYSVRTPRGGTHIYFAGSLPASVQKLGPKIDTRGRRSYVLVPPSVVNGKPYSVIDPSKPAPIPAWVAPLLKTKELGVGAAPNAVNMEAALAQGRAIVDKYKGPVLEGTRDNSAIRVAYWLRDAGLVGEDAYPLLAEWNEKYCVPPLSDEEIRIKVRSAQDNAQNPVGVNASAPTAETFRDFLNSPANDTNAARSTRRLPDPIDLGDLDAEPDEPVEMVIDRWVQKHIVNIFRGRGGSNKSRIGLQWAQLVDAGESKAGFAVTKATALYLSCEDDRKEVKRRRKMMRRTLELPASTVKYFDMLDQEDAYLLIVDDERGVMPTAIFADLEARALAIPGHKFIVLDSTYDVIDFLGSTKNSDAHVRAVIRLLDKFCRRTDSTLLCLWHPSRAGMKQGDEGGFATAWDNAPRNAVAITELEDETYELAAKKRNNMGKGQPLILRWDEGAMVPVTASDAEAIMEHEVVVEVALLAANSGQPIQRRGTPAKWIFEDIKVKSGGRKLNVKAIREHLESETRRSTARMMYRNHDPHGRGEPAGWVSKTVDTSAEVL